MYIRSTDGSDADDGSTWALAKATAVGMAAADAAGETHYISQAHTEGNTSTALTLAMAGTQASPSKILGVSDAAEPPTALALGATLIGSSVTIQGHVYVDSLTLEANTSIAAGSVAATVQHYRACRLRIVGTSSSSRINCGVNGAGVEPMVVLEDCTFKFGSASQKLTAFIGHTKIIGGSIEAGGTALTGSFIEVTAGGRPGSFQIDRLDFSGLASSCNLLTVSNGAGRFIIRNGKLPASWSGSLATGTFAPGFRAEMYDCASGDTHHSFWIQDYAGSVREESTIVRTGGAAKSQKFVTSADAEYPHQVLLGPEVAIPNTTTGSSITLEAEVVTDNVTLTDAEAWIEVTYKGTSGSTLGSLARDCKTDVLATAANQTTSSETWTTTGLTTPVKQKLSVSVTPQEEGVLMARVVVAKASTTVYVDPPRKV